MSLISLGGLAIPEEDTMVYNRPTVFAISSYDKKSGAGESVYLSIEDVIDDKEGLSFQWFECQDHNGTEPYAIDGALEKSYETPLFSEMGIRYYFCKIAEYSPEENDDLPIFIVAYTGLPVLSIDTIGGSTIWNQDEWIPATLTVGTENGGVSEQKIFAKGRGNSSWHLTPKCSYSVKFDRSIRPLGLSMGTHFALIPNYTDKTLLRDWWAGYLCKQVFNDEHWNPSYVQVELILNGLYMGNYSFAEKIEIGQERINIPSIKKIYKKTHSTAGLKLGGYVLEIDQHLLEELEELEEPEDLEELVFQTESGVFFSIKEPNLNELPENDQEVIVKYIQDFIQQLEEKIFQLKDSQSHNEQSCFDILDIDSVVNWYLFKELSKDEDSNFYSSVFFYYDPQKERLFMSPQWDFDLAFGNYGKGQIDSPEGRIIQNSWFDEFLQSTVFTERVKTRWREIKLPIVEKAIPALIQKSEDITVSANMNFERWRILGTHVWNNSSGSDERLTYQSEIDYMVNWVIKRVEWMDEMIEDL